MSELLNENFHVEKTPLFDFHNQMNAKLVSFGGYYLPINYTQALLPSIIILDLAQVFLMFHIWVKLRSMALL